jgi:hypothetical protein
MRKLKLKSVVSRPRPLSLPAFGNRVENFTAIDGRSTVSEANRTFAPITASMKSRVVVPLNVSIDESGAGTRSETDNQSCRPVFSCSSASELTPKLIPNVPTRDKLPVRPEAG